MKKLLLLLTLLFITIGCKESKDININSVSKLPAVKEEIAYKTGDVVYLKPDSTKVIISYIRGDNMSDIIFSSKEAGIFEIKEVNNALFY